MTKILIQLNTKEIRDYLESHGYSYYATYPPKEMNNILIADPIKKTYIGWDSFEKFMHIRNKLKEEFGVSSEILNCEKDINKFYEELSKI